MVHGLLAKLLILMLAVGGVLLAAPAMAASARPANQTAMSAQTATHTVQADVVAVGCALCQHASPNQPPQSPNPMSHCLATAGCGVAVIGASTLIRVPIGSDPPAASPAVHFRSLIAGPEPYPPRIS